MSFILDALRKSETERQHQGSAEFAAVPTSDDRRTAPPTWIWVVGVLLLVNLAVLVGILLRPDVSPPEPRVEPPAAVETQPEPVQREPEPAADFASRVAAARDNAPPREEAVAAETQTKVVETPVETPVRRTPTAALPTIHEVRAQGIVSLPDLHVDIHVYSESSKDRFVFINMVKHNEGSRLAEGPLVEEITPDGVVLSMNGTRFLLPRE